MNTIPKPGSKVRCINLCPEDALVIENIAYFHPFIPGLIIEVEITSKCNHCGVLTTLTSDQFWDHVREQLRQEEMAELAKIPNIVMLPDDAEVKIVKLKRGCQKCDYTGFAYGKIPCECTEP